MFSLLPTTLTLALLTSSTVTAAVSTVTLTSAAPSATSTSYTNDATFKQNMLDAHNFFRGEHDVSALVWNDTSSKVATSWSSGCDFKHSGGPTGENLAAGYVNASASVDAWGLERESYSWSKPGFSEATGHFTQVVWSNTTSVGCGRSSCGGRGGTPGWYVVCEYYPPGNIVGAGNQYFKDNVKKQSKGKKTDTVESGVTGAGNGIAGRRWGVGVLGTAVGAGLVIAW